MIIPRPLFWWLLAFGILLAFAGGIVPGLEKWVIIYDVILFAALFVSAKISLPKRDFELTRSTPSVLSVRTGNTIVLSLKNNSGANIRGKIRDEISANLKSEGNESLFSLKDNNQLRFEYEVVPQERGQALFHGCFLRIRGFLGLCDLQIKVGEPQEIPIYPNVKAVKEFDFLNNKGRLSQIGLRRTRYRGIGTEFESLREFQDGDETRRIDWKSSARRGKMVVKDYEVERNQSVVIVIDTGRSMAADAGQATKLDHVLDASLLVNNAVAKAGDLCGVITFDARVINSLAPKRGHQQTQKIVEALHHQYPSVLESDYRSLAKFLTKNQKKRSLVILFTEMDTPGKAQRLLDSIRALRHQHLWFVASVLDEELQKLLDQPLNQVATMFDTAALIGAEENRTLAKELLLRNGVSFTESEPQDLAISLVQKYFKAKQQGKLAN